MAITELTKAGNPLVPSTMTHKFSLASALKAALPPFTDLLTLHTFASQLPGT